MYQVSILNKTSRQISFEATAQTMQGHHLTVRALLRVSNSPTTVDLPDGMSFDMLRKAPTVAAEIAAGSPNYEITSLGPFQTVSSTTAVNAATTATNQATTAVNQVAPSAHQEVFTNPEAAGTSLGTVREDTGPGTLAAQPSSPCNLRVTFAAGYEGGDIEVTYTDPQGISGLTEVFVAAAGTTVQGTKPVATVQSFVNLTPAGAADLATLETGAMLAITRKTAAPDNLLSFFKLITVIAGVAADEAIAASSTAEGLFTPTTPKDGATTYQVWYRLTHTHTQDAHNHTQDAHNHTQTAHAHNLS